jgi:hypothetical protein
MIRTRTQAISFAAIVALAALALPEASWAQAVANQIPQPPANPPAPHGPMLYYGLFNWALLALIVAWILREAWRDRSAFPLAFLAGGALCAFTEPVFDGNIHVLFVYPPGVHFSWMFYNVPYPWYELPGNCFLAGPVYWMYKQFRNGIGAKGLWAYFVIGWIIDGIQELPGTIMGAYVYYGPQPFVFGNWPVWIGMMAGLGYALSGYTAYAMQKVMSGAALWIGYALLMSSVIYGCEVATWPMWIALNGGASLPTAHLAAVAALVLTLVAYYAMIQIYQRGRAEA